MRKRKVLQLIWGMNEGGAQSVVRDYALGIDKNKFYIEIVSVLPKLSNIYIDDLEHAGIRIHYIYRRWNVFSRSFHHFFGDRFIQSKLSRIVERLEPDIIHVHLYGLRHIAKIHLDSRIRIFYTCHGEPHRYFSNPSSLDFVAAKTLLERRQLTLIALHKDMQCKLNEMFGVSNTIVLGNGVNINSFLPSSVFKTKEEIRKDCNIPPDSFLIGHIGRFVKAKNHLFLLEIFKKCLQINSNCFLLLVGSGELKSKIVEKISEMEIGDRVLLLSNRKDIPQLLKSMDVFVFPSVTEGFPVTLIEAQAARIPCVVSDVVTDEAIVAQNVKVLSLNNDVNIWAQNCLQFKPSIDDKCELDKYSVENVISSLEKIYLGEIDN